VLPSMLCMRKAKRNQISSVESQLEEVIFTRRSLTISPYIELADCLHSNGWGVNGSDDRDNNLKMGSSFASDSIFSIESHAYGNLQ
jgi:hypothetical protein